jgi:hypothetical protein
MPEASPSAAPAAPVAPNISSTKSLIDYNLDGSKKQGSSGQPGRGEDGKFVSGKQKAEPGQPGQAAETAAERKLRLKVEGKDVEMSESEVISEAQKAKFAQAQATRIGKELELSRKERAALTEELKAAMTDDEAMKEVMRSLGRDPDKFAETILAARIKADMEAEEERRLPPEQRELRQLRREKEEREKGQLAKEREDAAKEYQARVQNHVQLIEKGMDNGLKGTTLEGNTFARVLFFQQVQNFVSMIEQGVKHPNTGRPWTVEDIPSPKTIGSWLEDDIAAMVSGLAKKNPSLSRKYLTQEVLSQLMEKPTANIPQHPDSSPNSPGAKESPAEEPEVQPVGLPRKPRKAKEPEHLNTPAALAEAMWKAKAKARGGPKGLARK